MPSTSPYFIPHGREQIAKFAVPIDEYLCRCDGYIDEFARLKKVAGCDEAMEAHRSMEYGSSIIHSVVTARPGSSTQHAQPRGDCEFAGNCDCRGADAGGSGGLAVHDGRRASAAVDRVHDAAR